jgi:hypothetical protein
MKMNIKVDMPKVQLRSSGGVPEELLRSCTNYSAPPSLFIERRRGGVPTLRGQQALKASIETINGKVILTVYYDKGRRDWDSAIEKALRAYNLKQGKCVVIARPLPESSGSQGVLFE